MPHVELPGGSVHYRVVGPDDPAAPPVVFVHGFLVDGTLWSGVAEELATKGVCSYAPDWPLGSHRVALANDADQSPRGVAGHVISFLEALDLEDVTLVGNDTGGAICQFVLDTDPTRIGRIVLTNCDAFESFPPPPFDKMFKAMRSTRAIQLGLAPMRARAVRHSKLGFGDLVAGELDADQTRSWIDPCLDDPKIRRDTARFLRQVDPGELVSVSNRLGRFDGPALLVWGAADRFFTIDLGRRLRDAFAHASLVEVPDGKTFLPLDQPGLLAGEIAGVSDGTRR